MEHDDLQEMVRAVRQFVRSEVVPEETTIDESDEIPQAHPSAGHRHGSLWVRASRRARWAWHDDDRGGAARVRAGLHDAGVPVDVRTNNGIAGHVLIEGATDEQKRHLLPGLASGAAAWLRSSRGTRWSNRSPSRQAKGRPDPTTPLREGPLRSRLLCPGVSDRLRSLGQTAAAKRSPRSRLRSVPMAIPRLKPRLLGLDAMRSRPRRPLRGDATPNEQISPVPQNRAQASQPAGRLERHV